MTKDTGDVILRPMLSSEGARHPMTGQPLKDARCEFEMPGCAARLGGR